MVRHAGEGRRRLRFQGGQEGRSGSRCVGGSRSARLLEGGDQLCLRLHLLLEEVNGLQELLCLFGVHGGW